MSAPPKPQQTPQVPIGHTAQRERLELNLPRVTLLLGPGGVGKRTLSRYLTAYYGVLAADTREVHRLTADASRGITEFCATAPFGQSKMVLVNLDGASGEALNALLKLLEEPPAFVWFLLRSSSSPLVTVLSRSSSVKLGLLSEDEVLRVLVERVGMDPRSATSAAATARGSVSTALVPGGPAARARVLSLVRSLAVRDLDLFRQALSSSRDSNWDEDCLRLLRDWFGEVLSGRWRLFSPEDAYGLQDHGDRLRAMMVALASVSGARPRLAVRAALEPFLSI